ncbi:MAG: hypothetical protein ACXWD3_18545, partial [Mycobacterium sp.]
SYSTIHVVADVAGYFPAGSDFTPFPNPTRILDTRDGTGTSAVGLIASSLAVAPRSARLLVAGASFEAQSLGSSRWSGEEL